MEGGFIFMASVNEVINTDKRPVFGKIILTNKRLVLAGPRGTVYQISKKAITKITQELPYGNWAQEVRQKKTLTVQFLKDDVKSETLLIFDTLNQSLTFEKKVLLEVLEGMQCFFKSPATINGVVNREVTWEKGTVASKGNLLLLKRVERSPVDIQTPPVKIEMNEITSGSTDFVNINNVEAKCIIIKQSSLEKSITTMIGGNPVVVEMLDGLVITIMKDVPCSAALSIRESQVLATIYSGADESNIIEDLLTIEYEQLSTIFEDLIKRGLIRVVRHKVEVELTKKGVRMLDIASQKNI